MREDVMEVKKEIEELKAESFAFELLKEQQRQSKRKDIIILVLLGIIALFVGGLVYVVTNYDFSYEQETVDMSGDNNNYNNNIGGDVHNGD